MFAQRAHFASAQFPMYSRGTDGDTARHDTAQHSRARYSTVQHGTAWHGTARHRTARHDTGQYRTARGCAGAQRSITCGTRCTFSLCDHTAIVDRGLWIVAEASPLVIRRACSVFSVHQPPSRVGPCRRRRTTSISIIHYPLSTVHCSRPVHRPSPSHLRIQSKRD